MAMAAKPHGVAEERAAVALVEREPLALGVPLLEEGLAGVRVVGVEEPVLGVRRWQVVGVAIPVEQQWVEPWEREEPRRQQMGGNAMDRPAMTSALT